MKLTDLMKASDAFTDETLTTANALNYANKCISQINARLGIALPFYADTTSEYTALTPSWQMTLLVPFLSYSVKMNDSSLNEAQMYKNEFEVAVSEFKSQMQDFVDDAYLNDQAGYEVIDTSEAIEMGWFGTSRWQGL